MSAEKKIAEPLEVLNLVMRKQFAQEILEGKKKIEFRAFSEHYSSRLYDKEVLFREDLERIFGPRPWETVETDNTIADSSDEEEEETQDNTQNDFEEV